MFLVSVMIVSVAPLAISCSGGQTEEAVITQPATGGQAQLADEEEAAPEQIEGESFAGEQKFIRDPWSGDLDGMVERRYIGHWWCKARPSTSTTRGGLVGSRTKGSREFENELKPEAKPQPRCSSACAVHSRES